MQVCSESHTACMSQRSPSATLPKRLLDISELSKGQVRLWEPGKDEHEPEHDSYACLSYCWGKSTFLKTITSNLDAHLTRIPLTDLPRIFQDAISVTQQLGLRYLWIDSLCIVQDDGDEWRQIAAQMASIYQNSHFVISAVSAPNVHSSLYGSPDAIHRSSEVTIGHCGGSDTTIQCRRHATHLPGLLDGIGRKEDSLPALSRGWIFQERLLAPRTIYFGPQEISWECLEASNCQCLQDEPQKKANAPWLDAGSLGSFSITKKVVNPRAMSSWNQQTIRRCWHRLVEEYSKLELSYELDILPALSGIAALLEPFQGSTYLAGLWEESLFQDLLWYSERPGEGPAVTPRPAQWRAPSWSWASLKCPVKFVDATGGLEPLCVLSEASCEPVTGAQRMGQLATGHLVLQGKLISTILHCPAPEDGNVKLQNRYTLEIARGRICNTWIDVEAPGAEGVHVSEQEVYCFPVGIKSASGALECLLLKKLSVVDDVGGQNHTLERIGMLELPKQSLRGLSSWTDREHAQVVRLI